jgi:hypothetical protein
MTIFWGDAWQFIAEAQRHVIELRAQTTDVQGQQVPGQVSEAQAQV